MLLRCQIQIEPVRRRYTPQEQQRLVELFGEPERWSQTLRPLLWENLNVSVPASPAQPWSSCSSPAPSTSTSQ